jgi:hypothetical protein
MASVWDGLDDLKGEVKILASDMADLIERLKRVVDSDDIKEVQDVVRDAITDLDYIYERLY